MEEVITMKIRLASDITKDSIVDGPGLRAVVWTQGCPHKCVGCHNPQTHDTCGGLEIEVGEIINDITSLKLHKGITLSGGEPLAQAEACTEIAKAAKRKNMDVWVYTGYTFDKIIKAANTYRSDWAEMLKYADVIVDGPFMKELHNPLLKFKGSSNQRVIDVKRSLAFGRVIEYGESELGSDVG